MGSSGRPYSSLGYAPVAQLSIRSFLPPGTALRPTLCISDTHLLPTEEPFGSDVPGDLHLLLRSMEGYQVFMLGDLIEALPLKPRQLRRLAATRRLKPILETLRWWPSLRYVPGNHDARVLPYLRAYLGSHRVFPGGFRVGRLVFIHGHEPRLDHTSLAANIPTSIPLGGSLKRLGIRVRAGVASNNAIASRYNALRAFPVFGHTHVPELGRAFANVGCFLSYLRSYLTIEGDVLTLWQRSS